MAGLPTNQTLLMKIALNERIGLWAPTEFSEAIDVLSRPRNQLCAHHECRQKFDPI
jgi:hypothetical protein